MVERNTKGYFKEKRNTWKVNAEAKACSKRDKEI